MRQLDELAGYSQDYVIDGSVQRGFLVYDDIPANTNLEPNQTIDFSPNAGIPVYQNVAGEWLPYTKFSASDFAIAFGLFVPDASLQGSGQNGGFEYAVRIIPNMPTGSLINNNITVDFDNDGQPDATSNTVCTNVEYNSNGANSQDDIRFLQASPDFRQELVNLSSGTLQPQHNRDDHFTDSSQYALDTMPNYQVSVDGVYVEIFDPRLNTTIGSADSTYDGKRISVKIISENTADTVVVNLLETGLNTGRFRSEVPVALSMSEASEGKACGPNTLENCLLLSGVNDRLFVEYESPDGGVVRIDLAVVDPAGVVFDSLSFDAVGGAVVEILNSDGTPAKDAVTGYAIAPQTTDETGLYRIPALPDGEYYVDVTPPSTYTFSSKTAPSLFGGQREVSDPSYGRDGALGQDGSGFFTMGINAPVEVFDIPVDPRLDLGALGINKTANVSFAEFGDTVNYTITLQNTSGSPFFDAEVRDTPAAGLMFVDGSLVVDGELVDITRDGRDIILPVGKIEAGSQRVVEYRMLVGPESRPGDAINSAFATARSGIGLDVISPDSKAIVNITDQGLMSDRGYIIGSVWIDKDGNGRRSEGELPLPGARVWRDDGSWVITDPEGRFTFYGQKEGRHMLRIDPDSLPSSFAATDVSARHFKAGTAVMVDIRDGDIVRADFALKCVSKIAAECTETQILNIVEGRKNDISSHSELEEAMRYEGQIGQETRGQQRLRNAFASADGDISSGLVGGRRLSGGALNTAPSKEGATGNGQSGVSKSKHTAPDPENIARTIGRVDVKKGVWLWPEVQPDEKRYARGGPVIVAIRPGIRPSLYINGEEVSDKRLGARIETADRKTQIVAWYGVELPAGKNEVAVKGTDSFGNLRDLAQTEMYSPSEGVELVIAPPEMPAKADGKSPIGFKVLSLDKAGMPARGVQFITLRAEHESNGEPVRFLSQDLQPDNPGHQIRLEEGEGYVELAPLELAGRVRILGDADGGMNTFVSLEVKAPMRDLFAVGLLDISAFANVIDGELEPVHDDEFPEELTTDGKSALFIKGRIRGNVLLTLAYDTEKTSNEGLFRDIDPEKYYPIYGESSVKGFEAQSRSKLYVRVENKYMSGMWGDFRTDVRQNESLVNQRQSLTGANILGKNGAFGLRAYAARGQQQRRTVRFSGQGVALFYSLPNAPLTPGSETLTIEVRARDNPGLIIEERSLQRFVDYLLDVETGQIILQSPIPSLDEEGNFLFLRVRYETLEIADKGMVAGGELSYTKNGTDIRVGGYYDDSRTDVESSAALSLAVEKEIGGGKAYAEFGVMESEMDDESTSSGTAFRIGGQTRLGGVDIDARLASADPEFVNPDSPIIAGRTEARVSARGNFFGANNSALSGTYSENNETGDSRMVVEARYEKRLGQWALQLGPRYQDIHSASSATNDAFTAANWRVSRNLSLVGQTATAFVEGEQSLSDDRQRLVIGGESSLGNKTRAYAVHRVIDQLPDQTAAVGLSTTQASRHQGQTVFGIETSILPNTRTFGEFRQDDVIDGRTGQASFGVRSDWPIADGITLSPSFERTQSLGLKAEDTGEEGEDVGGATNIGTISGTDDSTSLSIGLTDASSNKRRKTARVETRLNSNSHFWGARLGWAEQIGDNFTGSVKLQLVNDNVNNGANSKRFKVTSGIAWRPDTANKPDVFALYQFLDEQNTARDRQIHIASAHANLQLADRWTVSGRLAGKIENAQGFSSSAQLYSWKLRYDINKEFDTEVRLSGRTVNWGEASDWNVGLGIGVKAADNFRVHGGYNFGGFTDANLDPGGYHRSGFYGGVTVAITEDWFGFLRPTD